MAPPTYPVVVQPVRHSLGAQNVGANTTGISDYTAAGFELMAAGNYGGFFEYGGPTPLTLELVEQ